MKPLLFLAAPLIWFAHFSALYGIAAFSRRPTEGLLWALTALAALAVGGVWYLSRRSRSALAEMAGWLALLSLMGILFQGVALAIG